MRLVPVILYGDNTTAEERVAALDLGALDLLGQPFVSTELLARVRSALRAWHTLSILEQKAHRDHLTGLANRSALEDHLLRAWYAYERHGDPLAVVILDLDHFKAINDTFGHPTGDEVLRVAARSLANSVRGSDLVARYGGEEFVVVALDCPLTSAVCLAERFRARLAEHAISARGNEIPITVSAGIAMADRARQSGPTELLRHADEALYQAKRSGRNAVRVHNSCVAAVTEVTGPSLQPFTPLATASAPSVQFTTGKTGKGRPSRRAYAGTGDRAIMPASARRFVLTCVQGSLRRIITPAPG